MTEKVRIVVFVTEDQNRQIEQFAEANGMRSRQEWIRRVIESALTTWQPWQEKRVTTLKQRKRDKSAQKPDHKFVCVACMCNGEFCRDATRHRSAKYRSIDNDGNATLKAVWVDAKDRPVQAVMQKPRSQPAVEIER